MQEREREKLNVSIKRNFNKNKIKRDRGKLKQVSVWEENLYYTTTVSQYAKKSTIFCKRENQTVSTNICTSNSNNKLKEETKIHHNIFYVPGARETFYCRVCFKSTKESYF